ncbi:uncharacterized protein LOC118432930 isoform X2 [Folsomia candida]|uniref:uncharacterized protein LOC118432930 isoform X2 n=1 Tax=Folsomia candida TaxID=158441 RepID=UPI000B8EF911|nr:uncharacterized protein LOC118432930 isoform X2 [Folsomia candida]
MVVKKALKLQEIKDTDPKKVPVKFRFNLESDKNLLTTAINVNPFQLGKIKWNDVASSLLQVFGYRISARTARERVENLVNKYKKEQLIYKTGTEEEQSEVGKCVEEIIKLEEEEAASINIFLDADFDDQTLCALSKKDKKMDKILADVDRDEVLKRNYEDVPPTPNKTRTKRSKLSNEEDLLAKKVNHDLEMEQKRFRLEEEAKRAEIANDAKRLELELVREKRLQQETEQRQLMFETFQQTLKMLTDGLQNNKN